MKHLTIIFDHFQLRVSDEYMTRQKGVLDSLSSKIVFLAGSLIISISSGAGMTYAFNSNYLVVYVSFVGFIIGYKIAQIGYHNGKESFMIFLSDLSRLKNQKVNLLSFLGGSLFTSLGFVLLGKAVFQMSITLGVSSGAVIGGGYILAHWSVNNRLV